MLNPKIEELKEENERLERVYKAHLERARLQRDALSAENERLRAAIIVALAHVEADPPVCGICSLCRVYAKMLRDAL